MLNLSDFVYIFTRVSDIYLNADWNIPDNQFCYDANVHRSACLMHTAVCVIDDGLMCCYTSLAQCNKLSYYTRVLTLLLLSNYR